MYLNTHTYYSFRYGTLSPEQLVAEAADKGIEALALTDVNNTSGVIPFVQACRKQGIKPIVGIEYRWEGVLLYIGIARDTLGFRQLNEFLSAYLTLKEPFPDRAPFMDHVSVIYPFEKVAPVELRENEFIGIRPEEASKLRVHAHGAWPERMVILHPVTFVDKAGFNTHRLLRAIDCNTLLSKLPTSAQAHQGERMQTIDELLDSYRACPQLIYNTVKLLDECNFNLELATPKNKKTFTGAIYDDRLLLEKLALDGWKQRYGKDPYRVKEAKTRLDRELKVIDELGFSPYFLITWDIIRYAKSRSFRHVGRGSGANSIVAYCMGITDVDPIELDLYFERFINPHRSSPPDFDIDFSWDERDDVTDYIFKRYGRKHTALLATYSTFKGRSIIRELGKVFGLPKAEIDTLVRNPNDPSIQDDISKMIFKYGKRIIEFPNHLSIHAGGVLISEEPIYQYTATELPPKGFPTTQFDMYVAEDVGLYKYDILSQRGLGHIKDAVELVRENKGRAIDVDQITKFKPDPLLNAKLEVGDTIGCFYIESPAMRQLLRKLKCDNYLTLVAASSIIRPGVAKSGMMREYIERHHDPNNFEYLHPKMQELMQETYGVMVYQEDVIKVAHHFAGIELGDADILRRAMSGKYRSKDGFAKIRNTFFKNCAEREYPEKIAAEVWRQMESFGGYSFSKAHSASFAVESYQSLFLKTYFPHEFMVAVINNFGGFYSTEFYINEARKCGASIQAPCINNSRYTTIIYGIEIYLGFIHIKELGRDLGHTVEPERDRNGEFKNLEDFIKRIPVSLEQVNLLIRIGAFRFTKKTKKECLWEAAMFFGQLEGRKSSVRKTGLFQVPVKTFKLPDLAHTAVEDAYDELELLGFPLCNPYDFLAAPLPDKLIEAARLHEFERRHIQTVGYLVCTKDVRTANNGMMKFGTFLDHKMDIYDTVHFPPSLKRFPITGKAVYLMTGKVSLDFGVPTLEVTRLERLAWSSDPRYADAPNGRGPVHNALQAKSKRVGRWG